MPSAWSRWRCPPPGLAFSTAAGLLIGMAQAGTTYAVIYGVIAETIAGGQALLGHGRRGRRPFGQFLMVPVESWLDRPMGLAERVVHPRLRVLCILPLASGLREGPTPAASAKHQSIADAVREAFCGQPAC